jgi:hypothetical protein
MKNDLGFLCLELNQTHEHNMLLDLIKKIIDNNPFNQICIFNHSSLRSNYNNVPVFPISHCKFFEGDLFIFDNISLSMVQNFPGIQKKYFYCSEIPWSSPNSYYTLWEQLFTDKNLQVITNNISLQEIYKICWNIDTKNIKNFSYEEIIHAIR